ncbi:hypothetical protein VHEMI00001 [[Torrubiella] hemipterigena]|uniref:Uncharacterized protein n=1 Tax=[Torrubiella] hemipterigena TaxID=1531966 RepID=A0A0A1SP66_9HYPO|nr:hypothetical protein VHEMI00001 [[Torrubiella] hemipterigena]
MGRAFAMQLAQGTFSVFGFASILLWCLSPFGSQASLRVVDIVSPQTQTSHQVATLDTFAKYAYDFSNSLIETDSFLKPAIVASLVAAPLLNGRDQDLWGNVRPSALPPFGDDKATNNSYTSLVGLPVSQLPPAGNTSVEIPSSYLTLSCPLFEVSTQKAFTNYTSSNHPSPGNGVDCDWVSAMGGSRFQVALSTPCEKGSFPSPLTGTRPAARRFV